jgi:hypothetical protein
MFTAALLGATLLSALPVHVEADGCPSGTEIERRLEAMLRTTSPKPADVARVTRSGSGLRIDLVSADGVLIAERALEYAGTCAELADMVAVIVASWESDVHPEFARPAAEPVTTTAAAKAESVERPRFHFDIAAGAGASLADSVAFGGTATITWFPKGGSLGARLSGLGETTHTTNVGIRQAHWNRWLVGLELDWRLPGITTSLGFHGGVALAVLQAGGVNFDQNASDSSLSPAALAGTRWSLWVSRHWAAFADITANYCLRAQTLRGAETRQLPHLEGLLTLGVAVGESPGAR